MYPSFTLLSLLFVLVSTAFASPVGRATNNLLTLASKINPVRSGKTIADNDRARVAALLQNASDKKHGKRADSPVLATDIIVSYTASVGVGIPATQYSLIIDTGSSNIWVGADKAYKRTRSSKDTGNTVSVSYGSGSFSGEEYTDEVSLSPFLKIHKQSIGVASESTGFTNVDGIIGVGPQDLTVGTVSNTQTVPTVVDNLHSEGSITAATLGIFFQPTTAISILDAGELSFGFPNILRTTSRIEYVPITTTAPASSFWGIDQSVAYGSTDILSCAAGIVDTGTTLILLATDAFNAYQQATGGVLDQNTGLLQITPAQFKKLKPLDFSIGEKTYALSPNGQIWPRSLNTAIGGTAGSIYLIVSDLGTPSGLGLDFINGMAFLQRFYSVYDTGNSQVGFATTRFTNAKTN